MPDTTSILIVDDEPSVRSLLTEVLSAKFRCSSAESAGDAITLLENHSFEVALIDLGLPGMSGLGLCRLVVKVYPNTSVIVVSGNTDDESIAAAIQAGAVEYIKKPFDLVYVNATVERVLNCRRPDAVA